MLLNFWILFQNIKQLYTRLLPALRTKKDEMKRVGITYIQEEDIWNYLKEKKWKKANDLSLYDMVSDILNADNEYIDDYFKEKLNEKNREIYFK